MPSVNETASGFMPSVNETASGCMHSVNETVSGCVPSVNETASGFVPSVRETLSLNIPSEVIIVGNGLGYPSSIPRCGSSRFILNQFHWEKYLYISSLSSFWWNTITNWHLLTRSFGNRSERKNLNPVPMLPLGSNLLWHQGSRILSSGSNHVTQYKQSHVTWGGDWLRRVTYPFSLEDIMKNYFWE